MLHAIGKVGKPFCGVGAVADRSKVVGPALTETKLWAQDCHRRWNGGVRTIERTRLEDWRGEVK
jgi:hypothetical protein